MSPLVVYGTKAVCIVYRDFSCVHQRNGGIRILSSGSKLIVFSTVFALVLLKTILSHSAPVSSHTRGVSGPGVTRPGGHRVNGRGSVGRGHFPVGAGWFQRAGEGWCVFVLSGRRQRRLSRKAGRRLAGFGTLLRVPQASEKLSVSGSGGR